MNDTIVPLPRPKSRWGPWSPVLTDGVERIAQLRCIRTLVHVVMGSRKAPDYTDTVPALLRALRAAESIIRIYGESNNENAPLEDARILFDALPAGRQRDIIATFAVLHEPLAPEKDG